MGRVFGANLGRFTKKLAPNFLSWQVWQGSLLQVPSQTSSARVVVQFEFISDRGLLCLIV